MQIALESLENIANLVQAEQEDAQWRETTSLLNHQNQHSSHREGCLKCECIAIINITL